MTIAPFGSRRRRGGGQLAAIPYRWDPRREIDEINSRFGQLMQAFMGESPALAAGISALAPPIDVEETENAYIVDIDLPNVDPSDVSLEMRGEELRISGTFQQTDRGGVVRRQNRPTGEFEYVVDLPGDVDAERVEATYTNGVLTVSVAKARDAQPRRIEIQRKAAQQGQPGRPGQPGQPGGQPGQPGQPRPTAPQGQQTQQGQRR
ncbi:Hsp20/alpha crystallin family protein [Dactylosporangium sp. NPDC048998]|uniref:Hsp20/alpha crystallin family protein n=1 Tax=Dactylosporangium sp. NPDC048998 TaxID=3363976 RepID=UPI003712A325